MAQTQKQRMALIRKVSKKFNKKLKRNQRVRRTETSFLDKVDNGGSIYAYTDASLCKQAARMLRKKHTAALCPDWKN